MNCNERWRLVEAWAEMKYHRVLRTVSQNPWSACHKIDDTTHHLQSSLVTQAIVYSSMNSSDLDIPPQAQKTIGDFKKYATDRPLEVYLANLEKSHSGLDQKEHCSIGQ